MATNLLGGRGVDGSRHCGRKYSSGKQLLNGLQNAGRDVKNMKRRAKSDNVVDVEGTKGTRLALNSRCRASRAQARWLAPRACLGLRGAMTFLVQTADLDGRWQPSTQNFALFRAIRAIQYALFIDTNIGVIFSQACVQNAFECSCRGQPASHNQSVLSTRSVSTRADSTQDPP